MALRTIPMTKIAEAVRRLEYGTEFRRNIKLHWDSRLRTMLAIESSIIASRPFFDQNG